MISWVGTISLLVWFAISGIRLEKGVVFELALNHLPSIEVLQSMKQAYSDIRLNNTTASLFEADERPSASVRTVLEDRGTLWADFEQSWKEYVVLPREKNEDALWQSFQKAHEDYRVAEAATAEALIQLGRGGYGAEGQRKRFSRLHERLRQSKAPLLAAQRALDELVAFNLNAGNRKAAEAVASQSILLRRIYLISSLAVVVSLLVGSLLLTRILRETHERERLREELRNAVETRDDFISMASHELKTPLTALLVQLDLLARLPSTAVPDKESRIPQLAGSAHRSAQALAALLDELLDLTRIRIGKLTLDPHEMDLREAVFELVEQVRESAARKGSSISVQAEESVWGVWDSARIQQILSNLLSNAIKYGEGRPIEVRLSSGRGTPGDNLPVMAKLEVRDHGAGIPENMKNKIFTRFQRAGTGSTIGGLGLGLFIVRQIVEAHGGSITVSSERGQGSVFTVLLPMSLQPALKAS